MFIQGLTIGISIAAIIISLLAPNRNVIKTCYVTEWKETKGVSGVIREPLKTVCVKGETR